MNNREIPSLAKTLEDYKRAFTAFMGFLKNIRIDVRKVFFYSVLCAAAYYILVFSTFSILLQKVYYTYVFDSGIDDQGIWLLSRFLNPFVTVRGLNIFGDSITFYHLYMAPLFWFWDNINVIYIVQTIFIGLGAVPLFLFARDKLQSSFLAAAVAFSFLLYPALQNMNLDQYHSEAMTVFFMIMTIYYMLKKNYSLFYPFLILSFLGKDEVALTGIFIGLFVLLIQKERKHGWQVIGMSVAWLFLCSKILMPWLNGVGFFSPQPVTYSHWFQGLTQNILNPFFYVLNVFHPESLKYYLDLLLPLAFIPLLSLQILFLVVPSMAVNILSGTGYIRSISYHYNYVQSALIFFALIEGLHIFKTKKWPVEWFNPYRSIILGATILLFAIFSNNALSHLPLKDQWKAIAEMRKLASSYSVKEKDAAIALVPRDAKVSASYSLAPHMTHRKEIYMFPNPFMQNLWNQWFQEGKGLPPSGGHVEYIVVDFGNHGDEEQLILRYLMGSAYYKQIYRSGPIVVLKHQDYNRAANLGANYVLYDLDLSISLDEDFSLRLKEKGRGSLGMVYFPDSKYYFRNLLGEEILIGRKAALEISGYFYIPDPGHYSFNLQSEAKHMLEIDEKPVINAVNLSKGFHPYKIKYIYDGGRYNLKLKVTPPVGKSYILSDRDLVSKSDPELFSKIRRERDEEQRKYDEYLNHQPNLIFNSGFEDVLGNSPRAWRIECWQSADGASLCVVDAEVKKEGKYAAKLEHKLVADSRWVQEIRVSPHAYYKISGWIKTKDVPQKGAGAALVVEGAGIKTESIYGNIEWKYVEATGMTGDSQEKVKVLCRLGDYGAPNMGTAYFDDITFKKVIQGQ